MELGDENLPASCIYTDRAQKRRTLPCVACGDPVNGVRQCIHCFGHLHRHCGQSTRPGSLRSTNAVCTSCASAGEDAILVVTQILPSSTQQEKHPLSSASSDASSTSSSCPQNLTDLLSQLGLVQYNKNFQEAHVDLELLEGLDDGEWVEVFDACKVPIGARIKIKKSIRNQKGSTNANTNDAQREVKVGGPHPPPLLLSPPHPLSLNLPSTSPPSPLSLPPPPSPSPSPSPSRSPS
jgi:hypothetical protein